MGDSSSGMTDREAGELIAVVKQLSEEIKTLNSRIEELEGQLNKGKGILVGVMLSAAGLGASASSALGKWMS